MELSGLGLSGSIPQEIGRLSKLTHLDLSSNGLTVELPPSLVNLSQLVVLDLSGNQIGGPIPQQLGSLKSLVELDLSWNFFRGPIPISIVVLTNLTHLQMSLNNINGSIPVEIGNLKNLVSLDLSLNILNEPLPTVLFELTKLDLLSLSDNKISGSIPVEIGNLKNLACLNLSSNNLNGPLPSTLFQLTKLEVLVVSNNKIDGSIPPTLSQLIELTTLYMQSNLINGSIPSGIGNLKNLAYLNLRDNLISGIIPSQLGNLRHLVDLDLSNNSLQGTVSQSLLDKFPDSFGEIKDLNLSHGSRFILRVILPISIFVALFFTAVVLYRVWLKNKRGPLNKKETKIGDLFSMWNFDGEIAYEDIRNATEDFDIRYCIGVGGHGIVYRAQLPDGKLVALKKLHSFETKEPALRKSFANEVKTLSEIRHRNIVKLHGFCLYRGSMFLVYEYMEKGSLFAVLRNDAEAVELDWSKRTNIIKGTTYALSYMHHDCVPQIVHRDVTSNDILLNSELEACLSDFGTAKLLDPNSSNQTMLAGTYGYIAPG